MAGLLANYLHCFLSFIRSKTFGSPTLSISIRPGASGEFELLVGEYLPSVTTRVYSGVDVTVIPLPPAYIPDMCGKHYAGCGRSTASLSMVASRRFPSDLLFSRNVSTVLIIFTSGRETGCIYHKHVQFSLYFLEEELPLATYTANKLEMSTGLWWPLLLASRLFKGIGLFLDHLSDFKPASQIPV